MVICLLLPKDTRFETVQLHFIFKLCKKYIKKAIGCHVGKIKNKLFSKSRGMVWEIRKNLGEVWEYFLRNCIAKLVDGSSWKLVGSLLFDIADAIDVLEGNKPDIL